MRTDFVLDALEQAIYARGDDALTSLVHHSDQGVQLSMRYTDRLADAGIAPSFGSCDDADDNALAESLIGLFKTAVIQRKWRSQDSVDTRFPRLVSGFELLWADATEVAMPA